MTDATLALRKQLVRSLDWEEAHVGFHRALDDIPVAQRGKRPGGFAHSAWQLLEHIRLAQNDLLEFCLNAHYTQTLRWPDEYWPADPEPPRPAAWKASIGAFDADLKKLQQVVSDARIDLLAPVPTGKKQQTYLRAILLVMDHTAYHVGQVVALRGALGIWR